MNLVTITDDQQLSVTLLDYGARIAGIKFGHLNVALSYQKPEDYLSDPYYLGATIGPITNRISNGQLSINQQPFQLPRNEGSNCLHSGGNGFDKQVWTLTLREKARVEYQLDYDLSSIGLLGILSTTATYSVKKGTLRIEYRSHCTATAYVNLTNHVYLNLSGHPNVIDDHEFELHANALVLVDNANLPTGKTVALSSPLRYQLNKPPTLPQLAQGCDHHFDAKPGCFLRAVSNTTGLGVEVSGDSAGYQFYTGGFLAAPFSPSSGFCVEAQFAPDAINQANLYSPLLEAGEFYQKTTCFTFQQGMSI